MSRRGDRKRRRGLTCVASSSVSWSGLKPIWTFFGRWRKHLQNLKSGWRHMRQNGGRARQRPGTSGAQSPRGPHPGPTAGAAGTCSARRGSPPRGRLHRLAPAGSTHAGSPIRRFCTDFVVREAKAPTRLGQGRRWSEAASGARRPAGGDPGAALCPAPAAPAPRAPKVGPGEEPGRREPGAGKRGVSPGTAPFSVPAECAPARDWRDCDAPLFVVPPNKNKERNA